MYYKSRELLSLVIFLGLGLLQVFLFSNFKLYLVRYLSPSIIRVLHLAFLSPQSPLSTTLDVESFLAVLEVVRDFPATWVPAPAPAVDFLVPAIWSGLKGWNTVFFLWKIYCLIDCHFNGMQQVFPCVLGFDH